MSPRHCWANIYQCDAICHLGATSKCLLSPAMAKNVPQPDPKFALFLPFFSTSTLTLCLPSTLGCRLDIAGPTYVYETLYGTSGRHPSARWVRLWPKYYRHPDQNSLCPLCITPTLTLFFSSTLACRPDIAGPIYTNATLYATSGRHPSAF